MMMENEIDASVVASPLDGYQTGDLFPRLKFGPFNGLFNKVFMATPQEEARNATVNPFDITKSIPWLVIFLDLLVLLTVMLIINYKNTSRDQKISVLEAILLHTFRIQRSYKIFWRRSLFFFSIIYCFFSFCYLSSSISSDLVLDIPEKYLETLQNIVSSNRTPSLIVGFGMIEDLQKSKNEDPSVKIILQRLEERNSNVDAKKDPNAIINNALNLMKKKYVGLFETEHFAFLTKNLVCKLCKSSKSVPKFKISQPFGHKTIGYYYSSQIKPEIAYRLHTTDMWLHQSGLLLNEAVPDKQKYCRFLMEHKESQENKDIIMPFSAFKTPFNLFLFSLVFIIFLFIIECYIPFIEKYISNQNPVNQKCLRIRTLSFFCRIFSLK